MRQSVIDFQNYLTVYDSKAQEFKQVDITDGKRREMSRDLLRYPGEMGLDQRIFSINQWGRKFEEKGYYTDAYFGTLEHTRFWEDLKKYIYTGILIDDTYYITGDTIWYWNFIQIPDKIKKRPSLPGIWDTDIWWYQLLELAKLENKFTLTLKCRQRGFSLKEGAKILKRLWWEKGFSGKVSAWDDNYNITNWGILDEFRKALNENTPWKRKFGDTGDGKGKKGYWKESNLGSILKMANTKTNAASVVSGKTDEIFFDESGVAPNLNDTVGFVEPALKQGNIMTGEMHLLGAVGKLDKCKPMKSYFFKPDSGNFLSLPNRWSNRPGEQVCIFVPESYSFGTYMDKFGNSNVEAAEIFIKSEAEKVKADKGFQDYMLYKSQHPLTPEDCFAIRSKNIFPTEKIQPHYNNLLRDYKPLLVTLKESNTGITFKLGSKTPIVTDYPVKFDSLKEGAVVIDEPPINEKPPFGLYYAATDPIKPINTDTSESLQSTYIYKAAHDIDGELAMDKPVAWYVGRHTNPYETYEISLNLVKLYNARWAIENDQPTYIEWLIGEQESHRLMKRSEMPILKEWVPKSTIREEYGWRTGSGNSTVKNRLLELVVMYCEEEIGVTFDKDGHPEPVYGVTRIKDHMLLKEMLDYNGSNADRLIAFGGVLLAARTNTNRGLKVRSADHKKEQEVRDKALADYRRPSMKGGRIKLNSLRRMR